MGLVVRRDPGQTKSFWHEVQALLQASLKRWLHATIALRDSLDRDGAIGWRYRVTVGFPMTVAPAKPPRCPTRLPLFINSLRCRITPPCASRCAPSVQSTASKAPSCSQVKASTAPSQDDSAIDALIAELRHGALFGGRLDNLELKFSIAAEMPFVRMKVRLKREIVTLGDPQVDPLRAVGTYVDAADWNALIDQPDVLVIDTRNAFEVALGTFEGAIDPKLASFGEFKDFAAGLDPAKHTKVAMFCTGGIRCEKASSYLLAHGFTNVFHLKGGILNYLERISEADSRWRGDCFVFDDRIALTHGLQETRRRELFLEGAPDE